MANAAAEAPELFPTFRRAGKAVRRAAAPGAATRIAAREVPVGQAARAAGRVIAEPTKILKGLRKLVEVGIIRRIFRTLIKWIFVLAVLGAIFIALIFLANLYRTGAGGALYYGGLTEAQKAGAPVLAVTGVQDVWEIVTNPQRIFEPEYESEIEQTRQKEYGILITEFKQTRTTFSNEPIELAGLIEATTLQEQTQLSAFCSLDKKSGELKPDQKIPAILSCITCSGNNALLFKDQTQIIQARCVFPQGLIAKDPITSAQARLHLVYDFKTKASHSTYFLSAPIYDSLITQGLDPFQHFKIIEPNLLAGNKVQSRATPGPLNLGIGTATSQPFKEGQTSSFGVNLKWTSGKFGYEGNLDQIKEFNVMLPPFLIVEGESGFPQTGPSLCDFEPTGTIDIDGLKIYTLKPEAVQRYNQPCTKESLKATLLTEEECLRLFKKKVETDCLFKVIGVPQQDVPVYDFIRAEVVYSYTSSLPSTVTVRQLVPVA